MVGRSISRELRGEEEYCQEEKASMVRIVDEVDKAGAILGFYSRFIEEISSADFLLAMVLPKVKELENVCMSWLKIDGECAGSLADQRNEQRHHTHATLARYHSSSR